MKDARAKMKSMTRITKCSLCLEQDMACNADADYAQGPHDMGNKSHGCTRTDGLVGVGVEDCRYEQLGCTDLAAFVCSGVAAELLLCLVRVNLHAPHWQVSALELYWLTPTDVLCSIFAPCHCCK